MFTSQLASFAVITTLVGSAMAQFAILAPGGPNVWWVAQSQNTMTWTCHTDLPPSTGNAFQLLINNTNPSILTSAEAIIANVPIADCSLTVTQQQAALTPSTGYTLILADPVNQTKIYAVSQQFEVKALGASYPPASATPTETLSTAGATGTSGTSTGSGSSSSSTSTPKSNGAFASFEVSAAGVLAAIGAAIGML
ncbi:hypothetical protein DFH94DRAFT_741357 [Russula ochroleuca]|jgi:hypothetical protein|uniref:Yeast cell wall synthesis Kre9/Knh1-like N-terminal domain-containing protein n=1 Tax=Russula ochroleuca TaxID=152965 RepID=A0A9P5MW35_9AGAM|nr:hypothetical protein DFH94DRAFT_741357 [Russula ochroleuca]